MRKHFQISLTVAFFFTLLMMIATTTPVHAASGNWLDYATPNVTVGSITINTPQDLAGFALRASNGDTYSGYTVTLGADIDLSEHYWEPIGDASFNFKGSFNGNGHTISGMNIEATSIQYIGFFGYINNSTTTISNLNLTGHIYAANDGADLYIGGLGGQFTGVKVTNCNSAVSVDAQSARSVRAGSLIGMLQSASANLDLANCSASGSVNVSAIFNNTSTSGSSGGLIGYIYSGASSRIVKVTDCSATGNVSCFNNKLVNVGGLAGVTNYTTFTNCFATGSVSAPNTSASKFVGGFCGVLNSGSAANNCYALGNVTNGGSGTSSSVGGFCGGNYVLIKNCYSAGTVSSPVGSTNYVGGFCGANNNVSLTNCYYPYNAWTGNTRGYGNLTGTTPTNLTGLTTAQLQNSSVITNTYTTGTASYNGQYLLAALNAGKTALTGAISWDVIAGSNNGYPGFGCSVSFMSPDTSTLYLSISAIKGGVIAEPTAPTRDGYSFAGWFRDTTFTNYWDFMNDAVPGSVSLYSKWTEAIRYAISFDSNGSDSGEMRTLLNGTSGSAVTLPGKGDLIKANWVLIGWNTKQDRSGTSYPAGGSYTVPGNNTTLYAHWRLAGDISNDDQLSIRDAWDISRRGAGLITTSAIETLICDIDGNGSVNTLDARTVARKAARLE